MEKNEFLKLSIPEQNWELFSRLHVFLGELLCFKCKFYDKRKDYCFVNPSLDYQSPRFKLCVSYSERKKGDSEVLRIGIG